MGTNYYVTLPDGAQEELHIGKKSVGWTFLLHGYREYKVNDKLTINLDSWIKWKAFLKNPNMYIERDDGCPVRYEKFVEMVEMSRGAQMDHYTVLETNNLVTADDWRDSEDYSFYSGDFS